MNKSTWIHDLYMNTRHIHEYVCISYIHTHFSFAWFWPRNVNVCCVLLGALWTPGASLPALRPRAARRVHAGPLSPLHQENMGRKSGIWWPSDRESLTISGISHHRKVIHCPPNGARILQVFFPGQAVEAAKKANNPKTWQEVTRAESAGDAAPFGENGTYKRCWT